MVIKELLNWYHFGPILVFVGLYLYGEMVWEMKRDRGWCKMKWRIAGREVGKTGIEKEGIIGKTEINKVSGEGHIVVQ